MILNRTEIEKIIPHRPPFLWIDRILELEPGVRCIASKYIDPKADFFTGHFPKKPILPGVFIIEAAAQTTGVMLGSSSAKAPPVENTDTENTHLLLAVNRFKFLKPVKPGENIYIETKLIKQAGAMAYVEIIVSTSDDVAARGELAVFSS